MSHTTIIVFRFFKLVSKGPKSSKVELVHEDWSVASSGVKVSGHEELEVELEVAHQLGHRNHQRVVCHRRIAEVERNQFLNFLKNDENPF